MPNRVIKDQNYRFGFNGKEADREGQWGSTEHYDYGFRIYDPKIARFLSVDPLTSSYPWYTPYQFAGNKPIAAIDLDGLEEHIMVDGSKVTGPTSPKLLNTINEEIVENQIKTTTVTQPMNILSDREKEGLARFAELSGFLLEVLTLADAAPPTKTLSRLSPRRGFAQKGLTNSLVRATEKKAVEIINTVGNRKRSPVLSGVMDSKTGKIFFGTNKKGVEFENLHPVLQKRLNALNKRTNNLGNRPHYENEIAGSHSEINALNDALKARGNVSESELGEFLLQNRTLKGSRKIKGIPPRCQDCEELTKGVQIIE